MAINGHLVLLIIVTGLFVRLWSSNDRHGPDLSWRGPNRAVVTKAPPQPQAPIDQTPVRHISNIQSSHSELAVEEIWNRSNCPLPLPAGLSAGEYRVVNDAGRMARLVLDSSSQPTESNGISADLQTVNVGNQRWYFIRLQTAVAVERSNISVDEQANNVPNPIDAEPIRVAANRKFDFTGYELPSAEVPPQSGEFQPESPALPLDE